jgi:hypothetical protein
MFASDLLNYYACIDENQLYLNIYQNVLLVAVVLVRMPKSRWRPRYLNDKSITITCNSAAIWALMLSLAGPSGPVFDCTVCSN